MISSLDNLSMTNNKADVYRRLEQLSWFGRQTLEELRQTVWAMKHEKTDLNRVIQRVQKLKEQHIINPERLNIEITTHNSADINLTMEQSLNIFRIIQEALQNSIKHSNAKKIELDFHKTGQGLRLLIKDDGKGFDVNRVIHGDGLKNMKFRCEKADGQFNIISGSRGTKIYCDFKVK